jgi:exodeoxyribonuclease V
MIKNHILQILTNDLDYKLTDTQLVMLEKLADFISSEPDDKVFVVKGFAGTGKTTMINQMVKTLDYFKIHSFLMAPTGRAAKVLMNYTSKTSYTIHKKIYRQKSSVDGIGQFVLDKNMHKATLFIVDEASMISNQQSESAIFGSGRLLDDLLEYVYSGQGCRLVLVGDTAQLPPVGINLSPALNPAIINEYGFDCIESELTDVVRQDKESGVLLNATNLREFLNRAGDGDFFTIQTEGFEDMEKVTGGSLIGKISDCYDRYGVFDTIVLTRSNKRANLYNKGIRSSVLFRDSEIARGDLLMVVKNNYFWSAASENLDFIANGDIAEIMHIYGYENIHGFRFADVSLRFIDYKDIEIDCKIMLDTLEIETASLSREESVRLYNSVSEDYSDIRNKRDRWNKIRVDPYYNALQVKFAYAITCHKAQGGQWKAVFVDTGYLIPEMLDNEFYRWLYTAFTRTTEKLFLVNFDKRFF